MHSSWLLVVLAHGLTVLPSCLGEATREPGEYASFHLAHSWNFPETSSDSMILKDTPVGVTRALSLRARVVNSSYESGAGYWDAGALWSEGRKQSPTLLDKSTHAAEMASPDVTDRETLLNLARASWDTYYPGPSDDNWYDIHGMNWTSRIGWRPGEDGLRGHLFMSNDKKYGLVVFKGTTVFQFGTLPNPTTSERDRRNNNLLFSCCCANVPWRIETQHPCNCNAGGRKCCSSCLTESLKDEDTYYQNAQMVLHYFRHKYPHTTFWLAGHSLGGSIASLVGLHLTLPTITFEAPGERLAALRLNLVHSTSHALSLTHITHVYNDIDPLAQGECAGTLSVCAQAGYAMESQCHTGRVVVFPLKGHLDWRWMTRNPFLAHRIESVLRMIADESLEIPEAKAQIGCKDCTAWIYGEYPVRSRSWWRKLLDRVFGSE